MSSIYAPVERADEVIQAVKQCTKDMDLSPVEQALIQVLVIDNARQLALSTVADSIMRPINKSLQSICPFREHTLNVRLHGRAEVNE